MQEQTKEILGELARRLYHAALIVAIGCIIWGNAPHRHHHWISETLTNIRDNYGPDRSPLDFKP